MDIIIICLLLLLLKQQNDLKKISKLKSSLNKDFLVEQDCKELDKKNFNLDIYEKI